MVKMKIEDWKKSLEQLETMRAKMMKDVEEQTYMIECYQNKIKFIKQEKGGTQ